MHLDWRLISLGDGPAISTSITSAETGELQRLAYRADVLEIGAAFGYSAIAMALAGARVLSVDPHLTHQSYKAMQSNVDAYGMTEFIQIWCGYSQEALPHMVDLPKRFDVIFIDGDHTTAGVTNDVMWAQRLLTPGGVLACHDYAESCCCPEVGPAIDAALGERPHRMVDTLYVVEP